MRIVIAAFKHDEPADVYYSKVDTGIAAGQVQLAAMIGSEAVNAIQKGADYIAIRCVR